MCVCENGKSCGHIQITLLTGVKRNLCQLQIEKSLVDFLEKGHVIFLMNFTIE